MATFLKSIGNAASPLPINWMLERPEALDGTAFPKTPRSVRPGDFLIFYAAGRRCVVAIMEVVDNPKRMGHPSAWSEESRARWPWYVALRPHLLVPADDKAPTLEMVGFNPLRVRRQSHVRLTDEEYRRMVDTLASTATRSLA